MRADLKETRRIMIDDSAPQSAPRFLALDDGARLAYRRTPRDAAARGPNAATLVWLGGFRSDMQGGKAMDLHARAAAAGRGFLRFDYTGHGESDGEFVDGTIGRWRDDALAAIDRLTEGPLVLIGSSMGAWIALLAAQARRARIAGLVLIAPAPDFTSALMAPALPPEARAAIEADGVWMQPSPYGPSPITRALLADGAAHGVLDAGVAVDGPVRILHGTADEDVPTAHALRTLEAIDSPDAALTLVKGGDHRLSTPSDLERLWTTVDALARLVDSDVPAS